MMQNYCIHEFSSVKKSLHCVGNEKHKFFANICLWIFIFTFHEPHHCSKRRIYRPETRSTRLYRMLPICYMIENDSRCNIKSSKHLHLLYGKP